MTMKQIVARLNETKNLTAAAEASSWWEGLDADTKKQYIHDHPNSKYAKDAISAAKEGASGNDAPHINAEDPNSEQVRHQVKQVAGGMRKNSAKIASVLKKTMPRMHNAAAGLKALANGKPLEEEHKEALIELGTLAINTGLSRQMGVWHAVTIGRIGITAVKHGIEHFKKKKEQSPNKDDTEVFVESVADGMEQPVKPIPREEAKSFFSSALKNASSHIIQVADKSFHHVKPAVQGLNALRKGEPLDEGHKKAIKSLGMFAVATAITMLPGGALAHVGASVGVVAVKHAVKAIKDHKEAGVGLTEAFMTAAVESLEDSLLEAVAPEEEGHHH